MTASPTCRWSLKVAVTIAGDEMIVDYTGSAPQRAGRSTALTG